MKNTKKKKTIQPEVDRSRVYIVLQASIYESRYQYVYVCHWLRDCGYGAASPVYSGYGDAKKCLVPIYAVCMRLLRRMYCAYIYVYCMYGMLNSACAIHSATHVTNLSLRVPTFCCGHIHTHKDAARHTCVFLSTWRTRL